MRTPVKGRSGLGKGVLKSGFPRVGGALYCEGVPLSRIAAAVGTPSYVYSAATIRDRFTLLDRAVSGVPHRIHYTAKANTSAGVFRLIKELGGGIDVVSGGELHRALAAGFKATDIIFGGVGKTPDELRAGIEAGVLLINIESAGELATIERIGA